MSDSTASFHDEQADADKPTKAASEVIDELCDGFERAWRQGKEPRIESYLGRVSLSERARLLRELLRLELDLRGVPEVWDDYRKRFVEYDDIVDAVFRGETSASSTADADCIGDYRLHEVIGRGGMGVVFKATQIEAKRTVALKMIRAPELAGEDEVDRFRQEAEAAATLQHPHIVSVHEVGVDSGRHFFSMDFVEGQNLSELIRNGPLETRRAARYVKSMAEAVDYAHGKGVIHRDLKPANVLIDEFDQPRITDFGLAKRLDVTAVHTTTGAVMGTPEYMSPEQAQGLNDSIGRATDVYSLGASLFALITGRPPFQAATKVGTWRQVIYNEPVSPRVLNPAVGRDLETICLKCLEKDPSRRYQTAGELADDLACYLEHHPIKARPSGHIDRAWRWCKRNPAWAGMFATLAVLLLTLGIGGMVMAALEASLRRDRDTAQLEGLRRADIQSVPAMIDNLRPVLKDFVPRLTTLLNDPNLTEDERLRIRLALLPNDSSQVPYLEKRLLAASLDALPVLSDALSPYKAEIADKLWRIAREPDTDAKLLLRVSAVLAHYDCR